LQSSVLVHWLPFVLPLLVMLFLHIFFPSCVLFNQFSTVRRNCNLYAYQNCNRTWGSNPRQATFNVCEYRTILKFDSGHIGSASVNRALVSWPNIGNDPPTRKALLISVRIVTFLLLMRQNKAIRGYFWENSNGPYI
jgi:hypothetical protein